MQKFGSGQIVNEDGEAVRKTSSAPLSEEDVRNIESEGEED